MKTLIGHVAGQGFPSLGKTNQRSFPILVNGPHPTSIPWKTTAPFTAAAPADGWPRQSAEGTSGGPAASGFDLKKAGTPPRAPAIFAAFLGGDMSGTTTTNKTGA